jgi:hypothetical protein
MSDSKRRVGRPKTTPRTGPLVLEGERERVKIELEVSAETAAELKEYSRWVELSSARTTADALFATVDYALRKTFRRDRLWQEQRRNVARAEPASGPAQSAPASQLAAATVPPPARGASPARTNGNPP